MLTNNSSHAEGENTIASGWQGHAEGYTTTASGNWSHSEGYFTTASGNSSHAEGQQNSATGYYGAHAEGYLNIASGDASHAEGNTTISSGTNSHSEGSSTSASGNNSHAEGTGTRALGYASHAEGGTTSALWDYSHSEGEECYSNCYGAHSEGQFVYSGLTGIALTSYSYTGAGPAILTGVGLPVVLASAINFRAWLYFSTSSPFSVGSGRAPIYGTYEYDGSPNVATFTASGLPIGGPSTGVTLYYGYTDTQLVSPNGTNTHAEGYGTIAVGNTAHSEGYGTWAIGDDSHAQGYYCVSYGGNSFTSGVFCNASGLVSVCVGDTAFDNGNDRCFVWSGKSGGPTHPPSGPSQFSVSGNSFNIEMPAVTSPGSTLSYIPCIFNGVAGGIPFYN